MYYNRFYIFAKNVNGEKKKNLNIRLMDKSEEIFENHAYLC